MARRRHNTQTPRDRQKLVEDFERRLRFDEEQGDFRRWLRRPRSLAWVVHPLADETDLLAEIGITAEDCLWADAYWRYGDSVYFVRFISRTPPIIYCSNKAPVQAPPHTYSPGIYYRFDRNYRQDIFDIFLPGPAVTSADLHQTLQVLESLIDGGRVDAERAMLKDDGGRWSARRELLAQVE